MPEQKNDNLPNTAPTENGADDASFSPFSEELPEIGEPPSRPEEPEEEQPPYQPYPEGRSVTEEGEDEEVEDTSEGEGPIGPADTETGEDEGAAGRELEAERLRRMRELAQEDAAQEEAARKNAQQASSRDAETAEIKKRIKQRILFAVIGLLCNPITLTIIAAVICVMLVLSFLGATAASISNAL